MASNDKRKREVIVILILAAIGVVVLLVLRKKLAAATPGAGGAAGSAGGATMATPNTGYVSGATAPLQSSVASAYAEVGGVAPSGINPNYVLPSDIALPGVVPDTPTTAPAATGSGSGTFSSTLSTGLFGNGVTFDPAAAA